MCRRRRRRQERGFTDLIEKLKQKGKMMSNHLQLEVMVSHPQKTDLSVVVIVIIRGSGWLLSAVSSSVASAA
jgi:hypothetical protein